MKYTKKYTLGAFLVQWLRIHLPIQGTPVQSLVLEDPICCGATKPASHNYWACALHQEKSRQWEAHALQWRVNPSHCNQRKPAARKTQCSQKEISKNKSFFFKYTLHLYLVQIYLCVYVCVNACVCVWMNSNSFIMSMVVCHGLWYFLCNWVPP